MSSLLQQKIRDFIETKQLPLAAFEREAGLKTNVVRNILRGLSKRPTSDTLQAIASYMGCTIPELMGEEANSTRTPLRGPASPLVEKPELLSESLEAVLKSAQKANQQLTLLQAFSITEDVYNYALKKKSPHVDVDFIGWLLEKTKY
ncbi:MAG: helix-turn-helix transcriptional regulator [Holosporales bacterium]|nr:helix-turn-helix transcriptional regulator [Holosporales bacterium]